MYTFDEIEEIVQAELNSLLRSQPKDDPLGSDHEGYFNDDYDVEDATEELHEELFNELHPLLIEGGDLPGTEGWKEPIKAAVGVYAEKFGEGWLFMFGHDLSMTRNEHGTGFWDRGLDGDAGEVLTAWVKRFMKPMHLFAGEDGVDIDGEPVPGWAGKFHAEY